MFGKNQIVGKKYFKDANPDNENKLFITSQFGPTIQGEGPYRGQPAFFIRLAKCNLDCSFCFAPGTPILMGDGTQKPIETISIGDSVRTFHKGSWTIKNVISVFSRSVNEIIELKTQDKTVYVTAEHPFKVNDAWKNARDLVKGDEIFSVNQNQIVKSKKTIKNSSKAWKSLTDEQTITVYNFEVADSHAYVADEMLVHNCDTFFDDGDWMTFDEIETKIESVIEKFYQDKNISRPQWTRHEKSKTTPIENSTGGITFNPGFKKKMVLVMTGGEPMLQDALGPFLERMQDVFEYTQIESNGTQNTAIPHSTTLVCSPKCLEKNGIAVKYLEPRREILERADSLKFVMNSDVNSPYSSIPQWAHEWAQKTNKPVFVSPMNIYNSEPQKSKTLRATSNQIDLDTRSTVDEIIEFWEEGLLDMKSNELNHKWAAQYCITHGFIFNMQLHLFAGLA